MTGVKYGISTLKIRVQEIQHTQRRRRNSWRSKHITQQQLQQQQQQISDCVWTTWKNQSKTGPTTQHTLRKSYALRALPNFLISTRTVFFFSGATTHCGFAFCSPLAGLEPPRVRDFLITHNDAPLSVGLLWTSDQSVAETPTWQHTTLITDKIHAPDGIRTQDRSRQATVDLRLRPRSYWDRRLWFHIRLKYEHALWNVLMAVRLSQS